MSGAHTIRVQASRVESMAAQTRQSVTELAAAADRVGSALRQVAGAVPGTGLQSRAEEASGAWSSGLAELARAGDSLAVATRASAEAYRLVETRGVQRFTAEGLQ
ncbi:MAG: hypothetical protein ACR2FV_11785 [Ornithinimicrobium sp.]|uniref:hypothetical protein n=1 Tax=Ornithinimicrobium sp. TaxID=1977084 RepID=UPI003D9AEE1F